MFHESDNERELGESNSLRLLARASDAGRNVFRFSVVPKLIH